MIMCRRDICWFEKLQSVNDHFKASHLGDGEEVKSINFGLWFDGEWGEGGEMEGGGGGAHSWLYIGKAPVSLVSCSP